MIIGGFFVGNASVYKHFGFNNSFQNDFKWYRKDDKYLLRTGKKIEKFLRFIVLNNKEKNSNESNLEELNEYRVKLLDAIISDCIYSSVLDSIVVLRDFFWREKNRKSNEEVFKEIFFESKEAFDMVLEELINKTEMSKICNSFFLDKCINISDNIYKCVPKTLFPMYIYSMTYTIDSLYSNLEEAPQIVKSRLLPMQINPKRYSLLDVEKVDGSKGNKIKNNSKDDNKYPLIKETVFNNLQLEYRSFIKTLNNKRYINSLKKRNIYINPSLNLYQFSEATNLPEFFWSLQRYESTDYILKYNIFDEMDKSRIKSSFEKLSPIISIQGTKLKYLILNEGDFINDYMKDIKFWEIYNKLFQELKKGLFEVIEQDSAVELKDIPEEIKTSYVMYKTFSGSMNNLDECLNDRHSKLKEYTFNKEGQNEKEEYLNKIFEIAYTVISKKVNSYKSKANNDKNFTGSEIIWLGYDQYKKRKKK